ncbi:hypothetical protein LUZ60_015458 [Juncus effusus]|nr:hypothetical protein LUZ60_015458 [Juncus effusus]
MTIHTSTRISSSYFSPLKQPKPKPPPIHISTNRSALNPIQLQHFLSACDYSPHRFPLTGRRDPPELRKLRVALENSFVVVSVWCKKKYLEGGGDVGFGFGDVFGVRDERLVGFGRAVSDGGLTASIHDVVVIPCLRRRGIGRRIVERITRILSSREIYDISALCAENERLFFKTCGFGYDSLGSTTMMYTRSADPTSHDDVMVTAGRLRLLVPSSSYQLKLRKEV